MHTITNRHEATALALSQTIEPEVEVYGPDGRLLGRFAPALRPGMMYPEFGMTDEELDKLENDPNARWFTVEEVAARLRSLRGGS